MKKLTRHISILTILVIMAILTFASKGGGGNKKSNNNFQNSFTPISAVSSFTLKNSPSYSSANIYGVQKDKQRVSFNTMITYEKGNTIYILPYQYKTNSSTFSNAPKTNLQLLGVKIKMSK